MAGERSVRISFEAREELSRAVQQIDSALDNLKGSLATTAGALEGTDVSAEQLEGSLDEIGDEATQASIKLNSLMGPMGALNAEMAALRGQGIEIPIDIDDPDDVSVEEVRQKVLAQLKSDPPELPTDIDVDELIEELEGAKAFAEDVGMDPINMDVDLDESNMVSEVRKVKETAEEAAESIEMDTEVTSGETAELAEETRSAVNQVQETAGSIDIGFSGPSQGQIFSAVGRVSKGVQEIQETATTKIDLKFGGPSQGQVFSAGGRVSAAKNEIEAMVGDIKLDVDINVSDEALELATLVSSMSAVQAQALSTAASTRTAASGIDEMGDEAMESAAEMGALATVASMVSLNTTALSLNVGAFNIALANLATQIPILIGLLGTLATAIMGVVGALTLAVAGIGAFIGAGFVAELTRLEESFDNIESKAEAMQAIMRSLMDVFMQAIAPLTEMSEATDIFFGSINNTLKVINAFAKAIADSLSFSRQEMEEFITVGKSLGIIGDDMESSEVQDNIMSLGEFMDEVGDIFRENSDDIISSFKIMSAFLLPVLADIIEFFVAGFDDMIVFTTKFTKELASLGPVFSSLINFAVQLVDITSTVLQGLLPVMVGLMSVATTVADAFNQLNPAIIANIAGLALLGKVVSSVYGAYTALSGAIGKVIAGTILETTVTGTLANVKAVLAGRITALTGARRVANLIRSQAIGLIRTSTIAQLAMNNAIISGIGRTWGLITAKLADAKATLLQSTRLQTLISAMLLFIPHIAYAHARILQLVGAKLKDIAVSKMATAATYAQAAATWLLAGRTGAAIAAFAGLITTFGGYIVSALASAAATLGLAGAYATLSAATGGLLTALPAIAVALLAIVGAGAGAVGILANMDSVTSGLGKVMAGLKSALGDIVNVLLGTFIDVWNSLMMGFEGFMAIWNAIAGGFGRIAQALGFAGGEGSMLGGIWDMLMAVFNAALVPFELVYKVLGAVAFVIGGVLAAAIDVIVEVILILINIVKTLAGIWQMVIDRILKFIGISGGISAVVDGITSAIDTLINALMSIPEVASSIFNMFVGIVEGIVNEVIGAINGIIESLPKEVRGALGVETFEEVDLQGPEGTGQLSREDVVEEDTESAEDEVTSRPANNFNYNEENVNNVAQEINADPEDQEGLRRVVKDAMEEANAFNRRNQGHGG